MAAIRWVLVIFLRQHPCPAVPSGDVWGATFSWATSPGVSSCCRWGGLGWTQRGQFSGAPASSGACFQVFPWISLPQACQLRSTRSLWMRYWGSEPPTYPEEMAVGKEKGVLGREGSRAVIWDVCWGKEQACRSLSDILPRNATGVACRCRKWKWFAYATNRAGFGSGIWAPVLTDDAFFTLLLLLLCHLLVPTSCCALLRKAPTSLCFRPPFKMTFFCRDNQCSLLQGKTAFQYQF